MIGRTKRTSSVSRPRSLRRRKIAYYMQWYQIILYYYLWCLKVPKSVLRRRLLGTAGEGTYRSTGKRRSLKGCARYDKV